MGNALDHPRNPRGILNATSSSGPVEMDRAACLPNSQRQLLRHWRARSRGDQLPHAHPLRSSHKGQSAPLSHKAPAPAGAGRAPGPAKRGGSGRGRRRRRRPRRRAPRPGAHAGTAATAATGPATSGGHAPKACWRGCRTLRRARTIAASVAVTRWPHAALLAGTSAARRIGGYPSGSEIPGERQICGSGREPCPNGTICCNGGPGSPPACVPPRPGTSVCPGGA